MSLQQKALVLRAKQGNFEISSRGIPSPGIGQLLVKVQSVALNPAEYKTQEDEDDRLALQYPAVLGMDIAGIVEEVGQGVENFSKGDNVFAHGHFSNDMGAYQQYTLTVATFTAKIPSNQSFDSAATIPVCLDTAVVGMYGEHFGAGITPPWAEIDGNNKSKGPIVIIGGSSSVGAYAIQVARLSGFYPIVATASPSNEHLVRSYGATHFFDRHLSSDQLKEAIGKVTESPIGFVYDAISLPETQHIGWGLLADNGILILTLPAAVKDDESRGRKAIMTIGYPHWPQNHELCRNSWARVEKWLSEGVLQPNKYEILPNGLEGIIGGLERLRNGEVSGTKLVAHPQDN